MHPHIVETLVMTGLYAALLIIIGLYLYRTDNQADFIIGNRQVGTLPTAASLAATFRDGAGIAFWISMGLAAAYGAAAWFLLGIAIGAILVMIYGPRLRQRGAEHGYVTINEMVDHTVGPWAARSTALVMLAFTFCISALNFYVSGSLIATVVGLPLWLSVGIVGILLISYIIMGGYKSVIFTDTIQLFFIFSLICVPFILPATPEDMWNLASITELPVSDRFAFTILAAFIIISLPEAWQRCLSAKDSKTIRRALPLMTLMLIVMTLSLIWLGMGLRILPADSLAQYSESYLAVFDPKLGVSSWFVGYLVMVFIAITMSTQSSACYSFTSILNQIFMQPHKDDQSNHNTYVSRTKIQTVLFLGLSALASLTISNLIAALFDVISFFICIGPIYLLAIANPSWLQAWKQRDLALTVMMLTGIVLFLALYFTGLTSASFIYAVVPGVFTLALVFVTQLVLTIVRSE